MTGGDYGVCSNEFSDMNTSQPTCTGCLVNSNWPIPDWQPKVWDNPKNAQDTQQWFQLPVYASLTEEEKAILKSLAESWKLFVSLPNVSTDDLNEFRDAIHRTQQLIALRVARRANPEVWRQPE